MSEAVELGWRLLDTTDDIGSQLAVIDMERMLLDARDRMNLKLLAKVIASCQEP